MVNILGLFGTNTGSTTESNQGEEHSELGDDVLSLPPEEYYGPVEYKRQLTSVKPERLTHLATQMQFRLTEGNGECRYIIGVNDDGSFFGLGEKQLNETLKTLQSMAKKLLAETSVIRKREISKDKFVMELLVRKTNEESTNMDQRIAVLGNVDAGKSTLVGVLVNDELDNGRGRSRLQMFRHPHEMESGRTSSISIDLLMFDKNGNIVEEQSSTVKNFEIWDLAGDSKYMKTTLYGLTSSKPGYVILIISANKGIQGTTAEQLYAAYALALPVIVIVTKIDLVSPTGVSAQITKIEEFLSELPFNYVPVVADSASKSSNLANAITENTKLVPIFTTSSVTGAGLELLRKFIYLLPTATEDYRCDADCEFLVSRYYQHEEFQNNETDFFVVEGRLQSGIISKGDELKIGPDDRGSFHACTVLSIKQNDLSKQRLGAGHLATVKLRCTDKLLLRKGLHLVQNVPDVSLHFVAECSIFSISKKTKLRNIRVGQLMTAHVGNVRQTVRVDGIFINDERVSEVCSSQNHSPKIDFAFIKCPEVIKTDQRAVFRDDEIRISGRIHQTYPIISFTPTLSRLKTYTI